MKSLLKINKGRPVVGSLLRRTGGNTVVQVTAVDGDNLTVSSYGEYSSANWCITLSRRPRHNMPAVYMGQGRVAKTLPDYPKSQYGYWMYTHVTAHPSCKINHRS
jgi:hypothetical protein